jgi:C4-type Zn-finger protein
MNIDDKKSAESARIEHCPVCGAVETKNNVYFHRGKTIRVYVECAKCGNFVSRYTLSGYTSDKSYESLLEKMRSVRLNSGKRTLRLVEGFGEEVREEFEHVRSLIKEHEDVRKIENIIEDELDDFS